MATTELTANAEWPDPPADPIETLYYALAEVPNARIAETGQPIAPFAQVIAANRQRWESRYGPGSIERDWSLIQAALQGFDPANDGVTYDERGPTVSLDDFQQAFNTANNRIDSLYGVRDLSDISRDPPPPLIIDRLAPGHEHTILFGEGGVGKGTTAAYWATQLVADGHKVLIADYENHPSEWSRRIYGMARDPALLPGNIKHIAPNTLDWTGPPGAIWDQADEIRRICDRHGITYLIIDSIVFACAADASGGDTSLPARYAAALQKIHRPALSLAHTPKDGGLKFPFGSIFWHNGCRVSWSIQRHKDGDSTLLVNRKASEYEKQSARVMTIDWRDGLPRNITDIPYATAIADLIDEILEQPMTARDVADTLNADIEDESEHYNEKTVQTALRRGLKDSKRKGQRFTLDGNKYSRFGGYDTPPPLPEKPTQLRALEEEDAA